MLNTSLIEILKSFSTDEIKSFDDFIRSQYFNKKPTLSKLWDTLKKFAPDFNVDNLKRENIYKLMFPLKKFNYGVMKNIIYDFTKIVEKFIIINSKSGSDFYDRLHFLNELKSRGLTKHFEKELSSIRKSLNGMENDDEEYFIKEYYLQNLESENLFSKYGKNIPRSKNIIFDSAAKEENYLRKYYLKRSMNVLGFHFFFKNAVDIESIMPLSNAVQELYNIELPTEKILTIEHMFLRLNRDNINENEFKSFRDFAFGLLGDKNINKYTRYSLLMTLSKYCLIKYSQGESPFLKYTYDIYRKLFEHKLFDGQMATFRSIVIVSACLKKFKWLDDFVKESLNLLEAQNRQDAEQFYLAVKNFYSGEYNKSLENLSKLKSDDVFNRAYIKSYTIMNYYELGYYNELFDQTEVFKKFLVNNKSYPEMNSDADLNFIKFIKKIINVKENGEEDVLHLKKMIEKEKNISNNYWLLEKLSELKK